MLLELRAENYAVIDHAIAGFGPASISSREKPAPANPSSSTPSPSSWPESPLPGVIRHGSDRAVLSCVFESTPGAELILEANGIDMDADQSSSAANPR